MSLILPRYIRGMLLAPSKKSVVGAIRGIAFSQNLDQEIQKKIYKQVRLDLDWESLKRKHAYGFFPLGGYQFVACHFQLMALTEAESRGNPIFEEYIYITRNQLDEIDWNLLPVFDLLTDIPYFEKIESELTPYKLDSSRIDEITWYEVLQKYSPLAEAILINLLSSDKTIEIVSAPNDPRERLELVCGLVQCLPFQFRDPFSFSTLANPSSSNARLIYPTTISNSRAVDWLAPSIRNDMGSKYADWISNIIRSDSPASFKSKIKSLRLPVNKGVRQEGSDLDLAIEHKYWLEETKPLDIVRREHLEKWVADIKKFKPIFTLEEATAWLCQILLYAIRLSAYELGLIALVDHLSLIKEKDSHDQIVYHIVHNIFLNGPKETVQPIVDFIKKLNQHAEQAHRIHLVQFTQEIVLACIGSDTTKGLFLWSQITDIKWSHEKHWFIQGLKHADKLTDPSQFNLLVDRIGIPPLPEVFKELSAVLHRSDLIIQERYPATNTLVDNLNMMSESGRERIRLVAQSYHETKSINWLRSEVRYCLDHAGGFSEPLYLIDELKPDVSEEFLAYVTSLKDNNLIAYLSLTLMSYRLEKMALENDRFKMYLSNLNNVEFEYVLPAFGILQPKIEFLSIDQLEEFLVFFERFQVSINTQDVQKIIKAIRDNLDIKKRINKIKNTFAEIQRNDLSYEKISSFFREELAEILTHEDQMSWKVLVDYLDANSQLRETYSGSLALTLASMEIIDPLKVQSFISKVRELDLNYEADILVFALIPSFHSLIGDELSVEFGRALRLIISNHYSGRSRELIGLFLNKDIFLYHDILAGLIFTLVQKDIRMVKDLKGLIDKAEHPKRPTSPFIIRGLIELERFLPKDAWQELINQVYECIDAELKGHSRYQPSRKR